MEGFIAGVSPLDYERARMFGRPRCSLQPARPEIAPLVEAKSRRYNRIVFDSVAFIEHNRIVLKYAGSSPICSEPIEPTRFLVASPEDGQRAGDDVGTSSAW
jgi:hypothetical protein